MSLAPVRSLLLLAALSAMACASPSGPSMNFAGGSPVAPGRGERVAVDDAVVLLDASGSQIDAYADAQNAAGSFVDAMPNGGYNAGSIVFGGSQRAGQGLSAFSRAPLKSSVADTAHMGGYTPIPDVLAEAQAALAGGKGDAAIVLFSDGVPASGSRVQPSHASVAAARNLVASRPDDRVCIHTVQTGDSSVGAGVLAAIAAASECGTSRTAASLQTSAAMNSFAKTVFIAGGATPAPKPRPVAKAPGDADGDGVVDAKDACPTTPRGAPVNSRGCWVLQDMNFAFDSTEIQSQYTPRLDRAVRIMADNPGLRVAVEGHTDSRGAAVYNQSLSERRAKAVYDWAVKAGVDASRLEWKGMGEAHPAATNDTEEGRAENRRIQFRVLN